MMGTNGNGHRRGRRLWPVVGFASLLVADAALAGPVTLVRQDLANSTCMDGTPAAFYYDPKATATDEWVVILQGSNLCSNVAGEDGVEAATVAECARWCFANEASPTMSLDPTGAVDDPLVAGGGPDGFCDLPQASSSNWTPMLRKGALFDDGLAANPRLHDAQKIFVRSCSGDGWMGTADDVPSIGPVSSPLLALDFQGQLIIDDVFDFLMNDGVTITDDDDNDVIVHMTDGDELLFGGESRGAFGAWANLDRVCDNLTAVLPDLNCRGISASFFPGRYKPKWREDPMTHQPVPTQTFPQWVEVRTQRYGYQGIAHPQSCLDAFSGEDWLNPITPYELDFDDPSEAMCYTDLGILLSVTTPMFVSFNRFNYVDVYEWGAGCDRNDSPPLAGGPDCFNNQLAREAGIRAIAGRLPADFVSYFTAADRHLYLLDEQCQDGNGACWTDPNCLGLGSSCATDSASKADVFDDWLSGSLAGEIFWDIADNCPFP